MGRTPNLMDEVAAALQFPHYFGHNWAALDECLSDLGGLLPGKAIVILITDALNVLADEPVAELEAFVAAVRNASATYGSPIADGEWWDRPAVPFHAVLQAESAASRDVVHRWSAAGATVEPLLL